MKAKNEYTQDKWMTEGKDHRNLDEDHILLTKEMKSYLYADRLQFIASSKGMGKTLLLRYKKQEAGQSRSLQGVMLLPEEGEIDKPQLRGKHSSDRQDLEDCEFWAELWQFCFIISGAIYTYSRRPQGYAREPIWDLLESLPIGSVVKDTIRSSLVEEDGLKASDLLSEILQHSIGSFCENRDTLAKKAYKIAGYYIQSGIHYFIDSIDTALKAAYGTNTAIWMAGQQGLLIASYKLASEVEHLKIYGTLRQEAWNTFVHEDRQAIKGRVLNLKYTDSQLRNMFDKFVQVYEGKESITKMIGLDKIVNYSCLRVKEDPFDYVFRHTNYSPRSLSTMGREIAGADLNSISNDKARNEEVRRIVNDLSAEIVVSEFLLGQQRVFLSSIESKQDIRKLSKLIPSNVLPGWSLESINYWYAKDKNVDVSKSHPFCELLNIGLIGEVSRSTTKETHIKFKIPNEFDEKMEKEIEAEKLYFLHPGFTSFIIKENGVNFSESKLLVGQHCAVNEETISTLPTIFVSYKTEYKEDVVDWMRIFKRHIDTLIPNKLWMDHEAIPYGGEVQEYIEKGLKGSVLLFLFITKEALSSKWIDHEWKNKKYGEIKEGRVYILTILGEGARFEDMPDYLQQKRFFLWDDIEREDELTHLAKSCLKWIRRD